MSDELLVRDYALYRAVYCGLCRDMKKRISALFIPTLSYDFVFLAAFRETLAENTVKTEKTRCIAHPLKKRSYITSDEPLRYSSLAALVLIYYKLCDDITDADVGFFRRTFSRGYSRFLKGKIKKLSKTERELESFCESIREAYGEIEECERSRTDNPDLPAAAFGKLLGLAASFGLEGKDKLIASELGLHVGKYIYYIDAVDDLAKDFEKKSYNPFLIRFGTVEKVLEHTDEIDMALSCHIGAATAAAELTAHTAFTPIIDNILKKGLGMEAYRIFEKSKSCKKGKL